MASQSDSGRCYNAGDDINNFLKKLSKNRVTPGYLLRRLAASNDPELRMAVADHPNTPDEVLLFLANDLDADVRYALAENQNISKSVLTIMCDDTNPFVAHRAQTTLTKISVPWCGSSPSPVGDFGVNIAS